MYPTSTTHSIHVPITSPSVACFALTIDFDGVADVATKYASRSWFPLITLALLLTSRVLLPHAYHYSIGFTIDFTIDALLVAVLIAQLLQLYPAAYGAGLSGTPFVISAPSRTPFIYIINGDFRLVTDFPEGI